MIFYVRLGVDCWPHEDISHFLEILEKTPHNTESGEYWMPESGLREIMTNLHEELAVVWDKSLSLVFMCPKQLEALSNDYRPVVTDHVFLDDYVALMDDPRPIVKAIFVKLTGWFQISYKQLIKC